MPPKHALRNDHGAGGDLARTWAAHVDAVEVAMAFGDPIPAQAAATHARRCVLRGKTSDSVWGRCGCTSKTARAKRAPVMSGGEAVHARAKRAGTITASSPKVKKTTAKKKSTVKDIAGEEMDKSLRKKLGLHVSHHLKHRNGMYFCSHCGAHTTGAIPRLLSDPRREPTRLGSINLSRLAKGKRPQGYASWPNKKLGAKIKGKGKPP